MPDTPNLVGLSEHGPVLGPRGRVEHVAALVVQHSEAIFRRPTPAGGIDDENVAVAAQHLGTFTDRHRIAFPGLIGTRDEHARTRDRDWVLHRRDVNILLAVLLGRPTGPKEILPAIVDRHDRAVDGPTGGVDPAAADIFAAWIGAFRLQHPHAVVVVLAVVGGVIDVPFAIQEVQFRGPDVI